MIKILSLSFATILFLAASSTPSNLLKSVQASQEIPKAATVRITLVNAPGINNEGSRWEIAYELRIINQADDWKAWKLGKFKAGSEERVGELIKEGSGKNPLRFPENRQMVFKIPFSPEIQERLRNQPRDQVKHTAGKITPEEIQLLKEQEIKSQIFLFYPIINVYDAKLKKNIIIPQQLSWNFDGYPDAQFEIKIEIHDDGSYSFKSSLPTRKPSD